MARSLNKSRILVSKILGLMFFLCIFFTTSVIQDESIIHESFDMLGVFMVAICALGRLYCTAFLGGNKNQSLVTSGPFSVVRNPLYVFSLIGFTGIALMSSHIILVILIPSSFIVLYHFLIRREEEFLLQTFGASYTEYMQKVPRLLPNPKLYYMPENITVDLRLLANGAKDAIWWFAAYPLVELAEYIRELHLLPTPIVLF